MDISFFDSARSHGTEARSDAGERAGGDDNPNRGGVLIVHVNEGLVYSAGESYCGRSDLVACADAVTRVDGTEPVICHVLAAFGENASPRLLGVVFGVEYDECVQMLDWEACSDFEIWSANWPSPGTGTAITWAEAQRALVTEIYWFALYSYEGRSGNFALTAHPTQGGYFADDAIPSRLDPIAGYGVLGFFISGKRPCPGPQGAIGACCFEPEQCIMLPETACIESGGTYLGDDFPCEAAPCLPDVDGACCKRDGGCFVTDIEFCEDWLHGEFQGSGTVCFPDPCGPGSACCFPDGSCALLTAWACEVVDGMFQGEGSTCDPNPCSPGVVVIERSWGQLKQWYRDTMRP
jgi:hypothetical protein